MYKQKYQSGFAHLMIITVVLGLGLIGALGFVYYQNFIAKKSDEISKKPDVNKDKIPDKPTPTADYKTFTSDKYSISFKYPDNWSLANEKSSNEYGFFTQSVDVENEKGEAIATFATGIQGLGGTCDAPSTYSDIDSEPTNLKSDKAVALSFAVIANPGGGYNAHYGLNYGNGSLETGQVCPNTFYYVFDPGLGNHLMSFGDSPTGASKHFSSLESAKAYMNSDEYEQIKKMILSLNY